MNYNINQCCANCKHLCVNDELICINDKYPAQNAVYCLQMSSTIRIIHPDTLYRKMKDEITMNQLYEPGIGNDIFNPYKKDNIYCSFEPIITESNLYKIDHIIITFDNIMMERRNIFRLDGYMDLKEKHKEIDPILRLKIIAYIKIDDFLLMDRNRKSFPWRLDVYDSKVLRIFNTFILPGNYNKNNKTLWHNQLSILLKFDIPEYDNIIWKDLENQMI